jgi:hypothetical protein
LLPLLLLSLLHLLNILLAQLDVGVVQHCVIILVVVVIDCLARIIVLVDLLSATVAQSVSHAVPASMRHIILLFILLMVFYVFLGRVLVTDEEKVVQYAN